MITNELYPSILLDRRLSCLKLDRVIFFYKFAIPMSVLFMVLANVVLAKSAQFPLGKLLREDHEELDKKYILSLGLAFELLTMGCGCPLIMWVAMYSQSFMVTLCHILRLR